MRPRIPEHEAAVDLGDRWTLYHITPTERHSFLWQQFKLMLPPRTGAKWGERRVYNLAWNPLEQRLRKDQYSMHLELDAPGLYMRVMMHLELNFGPDWLTDPHGMGVTADEIQAEIARLKEMSRQSKAARRARQNAMSP
jgi:hypothetical protein